MQLCGAPHRCLLQELSIQLARQARPPLASHQLGPPLPSTQSNRKAPVALATHLAACCADWLLSEQSASADITLMELSRTPPPSKSSQTPVSANCLQLSFCTVSKVLKTSEAHLSAHSAAPAAPRSPPRSPAGGCPARSGSGGCRSRCGTWMGWRLLSPERRPPSPPALPARKLEMKTFRQPDWMLSVQVAVAAAVALLAAAHPDVCW